MTDDLKNIIESLLFACDTPLSLERMKSILSFADVKDIRDALERLSEEYEIRKGGFFLREAAGGYQLCTRPEHKEWIKRLRPSVQPRFSRAAMETLAIIAWKQPVIRSDIEHIRGGVDCGGVIRILLERRLVRILGRKEIPGRPLIYGTTRQFLEVFDLKDLRDLPSPREIEDLGNSLPETAPQISPDDLKDAADVLPGTVSEDSENTGTAAEDDSLPSDKSDPGSGGPSEDAGTAEDDIESADADPVDPIEPLDNPKEPSDISGQAGTHAEFSDPSGDDEADPVEKDLNSDSNMELPDDSEKNIPDNEKKA